MPKQRQVIESEIANWSDEDDAELRRLVSKRLKTKRGDDSRDFQFVASLLEGEDGERVVTNALSSGEIKRDFGVGDTGNVFVEHWNWGKESGIAVTKAEYYIFVLDGQEYQGEVFIGIKVDRLKRLLAKKAWVNNGGEQSKGKLLRVSSLLKTDSSITKAKTIS